MGTHSSHSGVLHGVTLSTMDVWLNSDDLCRYCGAIADTVDHLVPRSYSGEVGRAYVRTVPACRECNGALGASMELSIMRRREIARDYLRRKYQRVLNAPYWTDEDIAELEGPLRSYVEAAQAFRSVLMERLRWPESGAKYLVEVDGYGKATNVPLRP